MLRSAVADIRPALSWQFFLLVAAVLILPSAYTTAISSDYALFGEADVFTLIMSSGIALVFPLLAVSIYALPFSNELSQRYIFYTRTRSDIGRYIANKLLANAAMAAVFFFFVAFIPFLWAFFVDPALGLIGPYRSTVVGLSPSEMGDYATTLHTFSQLLSAGPWAYGIGYSLWLALNGALYATIGLLLLFVVPNRFVALSLPFLGYHILNFATAVAGIPQYSPASVFPFNVVQFPIWVPFMPFGILLALTGLLAIYVWQNTRRLDVLL